VLEFLQSKHQHYKIADPRSDKSKHQWIKQYRFTKYNSHTEANTVSL